MLIVGGGGHALVVVEVLRASGESIAGALTREGSRMPGLDRLGVPVVGTDSELGARIKDGAQRVFVAVGANRPRRRLVDDVLAGGGDLVSAISPDAIISASATIAPGALIMPGVVINALTQIGVGVIVNTRATIDHECDIGLCAHVGPGAALAGDVVVGEGALVGIGASIVPGRRIGAWSTVGAGAAVTCDVQDGMTVVGVPARPTGRT